MCCAAALICLLSPRVHGQVTSQRLATANSEPQNWLTYSGNYQSHRFSLLDQIAGQRQESEAAVGVSVAVAGNWRRHRSWSMA